MQCLKREDDESAKEREAIDRFQARVGNMNPEKRLRLIFGEFQELENDVCKRSKISRSRSDWFWWFNVMFNISIIGGSAGVTIVTAFTDEKNIPVIVLGAVMFFISSLHQFLKLGDRGFTYRDGNYRLQRVRQQIRDIIYRFQNYTPEQLLVLISEIRNSIDEIDIELYRSNMTGNVKFDPELGSLITEPRDNSQDLNRNVSDPGAKEYRDSVPSEIHIHLDSQHSSNGNTPATTPRHSPYFQRKIQRIQSKNSSDSETPGNTLKVYQNHIQNLGGVDLVSVSEDDSDN